MAHAHRSAFENATTLEQFEDSRQAAIEAIANDPSNAHISDKDIDAFAEGMLDKFLEDAGLATRHYALRAAALA